jgi:hypothetical protein
MHDPFIELELWGESGSVSLRVSQIVAVEEAPAMEAHPHLNLPFIGPRRRITTRAGAVHLVLAPKSKRRTAPGAAFPEKGAASPRCHGRGAE